MKFGAMNSTTSSFVQTNTVGTFSSCAFLSKISDAICFMASIFVIYISSFFRLFSIVEV